MPMPAFLPVLVLGVVIATQACSGDEVNLSKPATAGSAQAEIHHTLGGVSYRTFDNSIEDLRVASESALKEMDIDVVERRQREDAQDIFGTTGGRDVQITLEPLTASSSRMRVVAKQGSGLRDATTSTEIILQTDQALARHVAQRDGAD